MFFCAFPALPGIPVFVALVAFPAFVALVAGLFNPTLSLEGIDQVHLMAAFVQNAHAVQIGRAHV